MELYSLATAITVGKLTVQAVTVTKTCISVYNKINSISKWVTGKRPQDTCIILDSTDQNPEAFVVVSVDSGKAKNKRPKQTKPSKKLLCHKDSTL